jgi:hypothetical protein
MFSDTRIQRTRFCCGEKIFSRVCLVLLLLATFLLPEAVTAYRMGDVVNTEISFTGQEPKDTLRSQMPRFGRPTRATVDLPPDTSQPQTIGISFQEGLWGLPSLPVENSRHQVLFTALVTFVYDSSESGTIHAVHVKPSYREANQQDEEDQGKRSFRIRYKWVQETTAAVVAGQAIMYLLVFLATVFYLILACGVFSVGGDDDDEAGIQSSGNGVPKWD